MNIRLLAGAAAIAAAAVLAYGGYQLLPQGPALTRSEVIGELDGPPLAAHARADLYRYGERQLLVGTMSKASWDPAGLARAQVLDGDEPGLQALARGQRAAMAQTGAAGGGQGKAGAPDPAVSAFAASGARSLVYSGDGTGVFTLRASIAADAGAGLVGTPQGRTLFLVTEALHRSGPDQPQAAGGVFRSEDQGLRWSYDAQVALGAPERRALFLSETRAVALEPREGDERLLYTEDGARRWQAATIMEQVWPDAGAYGKAFDAQAERTRGLGQADRLAYRWSLYPLGETQAVGWSWRVRVKTGTDAPQLIETRRFEIAFQDGAPPAFRIQQAAAPAPFQDAFAAPRTDASGALRQASGGQIYQLDPASREWHGVAAAPLLRGAPSRIGRAWFGREGWMVLACAEFLFSPDGGTCAYFHTRDQGRNWRPFQLSPGQEDGLLGLDEAGEGVLTLALREGRTAILRYPLD